MQRDPLQPRLKELVLVHIDAGEAKSFDTLLTRVPGIGEDVGREDRTYRVIHVQHEPVNDEGYARFGWHAFVTAELQPEEAPPQRRRGRKAK